MCQIKCPQQIEMNIMNSIGLRSKCFVVLGKLLTTAVVLGSLALGVPDYKVNAGKDNHQLRKVQKGRK